MLKKDEKKQLIKIAKMYYLEELTQENIAKKIGVSRPMISKMLQKARAEGIVEVTIHDDGSDLAELEQQISNQFQLLDVVIVPTADMNDDWVRNALGKAAAQYLSKSLRGAKKIGVSWGKTLLQMVKEYPIEAHADIHVIPLVGGIGTHTVELHSNQLAYELAKKLNGKSESLYAPAIVETVELKKSLIDSPHIASVIEQGKLVDIAIVGIGNPYDHSTIAELGYLAEAEIAELKKANIVGDIGSKYIMLDGTESSHPINQRVIAMELQQLKKIQKVIGVAAGSHKKEAILAALRGRYIHVLITDEQMAQELQQYI